MNLKVTLFSAVVVVAAGGLVRAADETPPPSFTKDVTPFVTKYCMECHTGAKAKKGYKVDSFDALTKTNGRGALVVASEPDKSLMVRTLEGKGKKMPPAKYTAQPKAEEITMIRDWIKAGAKNDTEVADDKKNTDPADKK